MCIQRHGTSNIASFPCKGSEKTGETGEIVILVATSGDTGKAALEGFKDVEGTRIIVFYPQDGVSQVQKMQMVTQEGKNVYTIGVEGNFDDAQSGVKAILPMKNLSRKWTKAISNFHRRIPLTGGDLYLR